MNKLLTHPMFWAGLLGLGLAAAPVIAHHSDFPTLFTLASMTLLVLQFVFSVFRDPNAKVPLHCYLVNFLYMLVNAMRAGYAVTHAVNPRMAPGAIGHLVLGVLMFAFFYAHDRRIDRRRPRKG